MSDAVDRAVADISFSELSGEKVYLDTRYISTSFKPVGFVSSDYIVSALRQQLITANCQLQDSKDDADYIVEARVGTLGTDQHNLTVGVPASNTLSTAASLVPSAPAIPAIPEISFIRRDDAVAAAKIAVFAYHRETKRPVWQSGIARARSKAHDTWVLGAGPFQRGSIHDGTRLAGSELDVSLPAGDGSKRPKDGYSNYSSEVRYVREPSLSSPDVQQAGHNDDASPADTNAKK